MITTIIGNLTADVTLAYTPTGDARANLTIAVTPRDFDRQTQSWRDGEPTFVRVTLWRDEAEHAANSLQKGARVLAHGELRSRSYETRDGEKRTGLELHRAELAASLKFATAVVQRQPRQTAPPPPSAPAAPAAPPLPIDEEPPF